MKDVMAHLYRHHPEYKKGYEQGYLDGKAFAEENTNRVDIDEVAKIEPVSFSGGFRERFEH